MFAQAGNCLMLGRFAPRSAPRKAPASQHQGTGIRLGRGGQTDRQRSLRKCSSLRDPEPGDEGVRVIWIERRIGFNAKDGRLAQIVNDRLDRKCEAHTSLEFGAAIDPGRAVAQLEPVLAVTDVWQQHALARREGLLEEGRTACHR